ncbi:hypothetical protein SprV_0401499900 [Sparganum proliferum]
MGDLEGNPYGLNYNDILTSMMSGEEEEMEDLRLFDYGDTGGEEWEDETGRWHFQPYPSLSPSWWEDLYSFAQNILHQVLPNMLFSLALCLLWRISFLILIRCPPERGGGDPQQPKRQIPLWREALLHALSVALGILLLGHYFGAHCTLPIAFIITLGLLQCGLRYLTHTNLTPIAHRSTSTSPSSWSGGIVLITLACLSVQLYGEFFMIPEDWHTIRGTVMVIIMKAICATSTSQTTGSFGPSDVFLQFLSWCGYAFSPGSIIFGPWFGYCDYLDTLRFPYQPKSSFLGDIMQTCVSCLCCLGCIIYSTYLSSIVYSSYWTTYRWINAFVQSQSFRFSHYFVCFFSQSLQELIGFSTITGPPFHRGRRFSKCANPVAVEFPRSLVDVVIHWNFPMHIWLKQFVYKPTRKFGQLPALLLTYAFSSLLHGLNFQLAAVLFSIGIYAYIEFVFRQRLSELLSTCTGARPCPPKCGHTRKNGFLVRLINLAFSVLAIFHLAYLAVMFDTSEEQARGYNMFHVFSKWSQLHFMSHIVAMLTYLAYIFIK